MRSIIRCELTQVPAKPGGLTSGLSDEAPNIAQVRIIAGFIFIC